MSEPSGLLLAADSAAGTYDRVVAVGPPREATWPDGVLAAEVALRGTVRAVALVPRPEWPALLSCRSRRVDGTWSTELRFAEPVDVAAVVAEVARQEVWRGSVAAPAAPGLDERVLNPTGFLPAATGPVVDVATLPEVTYDVVAGLREAAAVRVTTWDDAAARAVPALALAGVPVVAEESGPAGLGSLADLVTAPLDTADPVAREEHSVLLRRAAFDGFSAWAARGSRHPSVSVLLATRREDMLDFALAQVARQRGVDRLELVLAPHGFDVPPSRVQDAVGPDVAVQVRPHPTTTLFGDVLHDAARAAQGDVLLKMDDDDWYAPDVVADLLRARAWSGAELVGMPAELHYLAERDLTVKRGHPVEVYAGFVAGGTMLVDRSALAAAGGFRSVRKWVDAQLIDALQAMGATVYRTHGLGYVLRRNPTGHTWQVDLDYLLDPSRTVATWEGFHPSRLLEPDPRWLPTPG
jgi:hypothetical protein